MRVVNVKGLPPNDPSVVYVGRGSGGWSWSDWANPFSHLPNSRAIYRCQDLREAIENYRLFLGAVLLDQKSSPLKTFGRWSEGITFRTREQLLGFMSELKESDTLGCWCVSSEELPPKGEEKCHAQIIWRMWKHLREKPCTI